MVDPYSEAGRVHICDLLQAIGFMIIGVVTWVQTMIYPSDAINRKVMAFGVLMVTFIFVTGVLESYDMLSSTISWLYLCAMGKALSNMLKWPAQIIHNYR